MGAFRSASLETASGKDPPATLLRRCYVAAACLPQAGLEPGERAKGERPSLFSPPSSRPEQAVFSSARFLRAACGAEGPWRKPLPTSTRVNSYSRNRIAATVIPTVTGDFFLHSRLRECRTWSGGTVAILVYSVSWRRCSSQHQLPSSGPDGQQPIETSHLERAIPHFSPA